MNVSVDQVDWALVAPFIVIHFILMAIALVDCARNPHTNGPKWLWCIIVVAVSLFGPIAYFVIGRGQQS